jgi:hypothetical protein
LRTTKAIAELRTKKVAELRLRTFKIWLPQYATFHSLLLGPLLSSPFTSAQDGFKKIFQNCLFPWKPKTCLKGTVAWDFLPLIFFSWIYQIPQPKICQHFGSEALKLWTWSGGLQKNLRLRSCGVAVAKQHFWKSCGIAIAEVLPSSCGIVIAD